jgi:hypothetical protein
MLAIGSLFFAFLKGKFGEFGGTISLVVAVVAAAAAWDYSRVQKGVHKGVQQEQSRVEKIGQETNAKARTNIERALRKPDDSLRKYLRTD